MGWNWRKSAEYGDESCLVIFINKRLSLTCQAGHIDQEDVPAVFSADSQFAAGGKNDGCQMIFIKYFMQYHWLILISICVVPASGQDSVGINIPYLDTLLLNQEFDQFEQFLAKGSINEIMEQKYRTLSSVLKRVLEYNEEDLAGISDAALSYEDVYSEYQSGPVAAEYYGNFKRYHKAGDYLKAIQWFKIANFHKSTYLGILSAHVQLKLDSAKTSLNAGSYSDAFDILKSIEYDIYNIEKLMEYRETYDMRLSQCRFVEDKRAKELLLADKRYDPPHQNEIYILGGQQVSSVKLSGDRARYSYYADAPEHRIITYVSNVKATHGHFLGVNFSRKFIGNTCFDLTYAEGITEYSGENALNGLTTEFTAEYQLVGIGIRYLFQTAGRFKAWTGFQYTARESKSLEEKYEDPDHTSISRYYLAFNEGDDRYIDLNLGFTLYLQSIRPITVQPRISYIHALSEPEYFGPSQILVSLSIGTHF